MLTEACLTLDRTEIALTDIQSMSRRDDHVQVLVWTEDGDDSRTLLPFPLKIYGRADLVKRQLNWMLSRRRADRHRELLESQGLGDHFRGVVCPSCQAMIDLSSFESTPQVYCEYCDTVSTLQGAERLHYEANYRLCDCCEMFSSPRKFTTVYFYYLIIFYGWHSSHSHRCPGCMRGEAWKMLAGNLVFMLGVPMACYQLIRAYSSDRIAGPFRGLHAGNLAVRRGQLRKALPIYEQILERVNVSAGLHYNLAYSLLQAGQLEQAVQAAELSLADCSNYTPSCSLLVYLYTQMGRDDQAEALRRRWGSASLTEPYGRQAVDETIN